MYFIFFGEICDIGFYQCKSMENLDFDYYLFFIWFCNISVKDIFVQKMIK